MTLSDLNPNWELLLHGLHVRDHAYGTASGLNVVQHRDG